jgi:hypothetical protein
VKKKVALVGAGTVAFIDKFYTYIHEYEFN